VEWPATFYAWKAGEGCPACAEGRPDANDAGVRFYDLLGNSVPHLHTHIVPRYADDPRPGWPFPFPDPDPPPMPEGRLLADVALLRAQLSAGRARPCGTT
jgi:diadenosine tetraphosphate (Ap4A) HIT family hydrolase